MKFNVFSLAGLTAILCLLATTVYSQRAPMRFGRIDRTELNMPYYEADSTAKAVVLGDYGMVEMRWSNDRGFYYSYTRHLRVKIFHQDATDLADFRIYLHSGSSGRERLSTLRGNIHTPENGRMVRTRFRRSDSYTEDVNDYLRSVNFTLPNVREGSVFEIQYTIDSPFLFTLPIWAFQSEYPTVFSEFRTLIPDYFIYRPLMQGYLSLSEHDSNIRSDDVVFTRYRVNDAPAFQREPFMNALINYVSKIELELAAFTPRYGRQLDFSTTWPQLTKTLLESSSFGRQIERSGFLTEEAEAIKAAHDNDQDRMIAAFELIQGEMTWNNSNSIYARRTLRRAWNDKEGNAADINLMLIALLREMDINADPVILSTRSNGMINPAQIMLNKFNYVIAHARIDGEIYLMDATQKHVPYYLLPERALNDRGRLICERRGDWVNLEAFNENLIHVKSNIQLKACGSVHTTLEKEKTNYYRLSLESRFRTFDREEDFMDNFERSNEGVDLIDFELLNNNDWNNQLISKYEYEIPEIDPAPRDLLYINPLMTDRIETNPFRLEAREYPVDFIYPQKRIYEITIQIPEGYEVDEMPRNTRFSIPRRGGSYAASYTRLECGNILVNIEWEIAKAMFLPNEYQGLREFYSRMVEEQSRNIVLRGI